MRFNVKRQLLIVILLPLIQACSLLQVATGNVGNGAAVECLKYNTNTGELSQLKLKLPGGSGREFDVIDNSEGPCSLKLDGVNQGEDRTGGLFGLIGMILTGG